MQTYRVTDIRGIVAGTWKPNQPMVIGRGQTITKTPTGQFLVDGKVVQLNDQIMANLQTKGRINVIA